MSKDNDRTLEIHLSGSPAVKDVAATVSTAQDLIDAVAKQHVSMTVTAYCRCDTCGARSEAVDLSQPEAAEAALRDAGWVRDDDAHTDTCPACAGAR